MPLPQTHMEGQYWWAPRPFWFKRRMEMSDVAVTQEETEAMFSKMTSVMEYLRNQLVNNTELAKQVQALTAQVNDLTGQIHSVVGQNTALQEAVNVLTGERDRAQQEAVDGRNRHSEVEQKFNQ